MDNRVEVREVLTSRRAKITPQQAGLPEVGSRRVAGVRRGEVAALAGVSIEYYSKLERGSLAGVSASVLDAIARAIWYVNAGGGVRSPRGGRPALCTACATRVRLRLVREVLRG